MGYLHELISISHKAKRLERHWRPHLNRTRQAILRIANSTPNKDTIIVFGSGVLLDAPIEELSNMFKKVILLDIYHTRDTLKKLIQYKNVTVLPRDLSGIAEALWEQYKDGKKLRYLPEPLSTYNSLTKNVSLAVSLNLLTQLSFVPTVFLSRFKKISITQEAISCWKESFCTAHIKALNGLDCPKCIVTDHESLCKDFSGRIIARNSTVFEDANHISESADIFLQLMEKNGWRRFDCWQWDINPAGEKSKDMAEQLTVSAFYKCG